MNCSGAVSLVYISLQILQINSQTVSPPSLSASDVIEKSHPGDLLFLRPDIAFLTFSKVIGPVLMLSSCFAGFMFC